MAASGWGGAYSNPFANQAAAAAPSEAADSARANAGGAFGAWGAGVGSARAPEASAPPVQPAPVYSSGAAGGGDLAAREAALQRREAELARREAQLAAGAPAGTLRNWPSCCPIIYHNISEQIPPWNRSMIRFAYLVELVTLAAFFYNTLVLLATLFAGLPTPGLTWWFLAVIVLVIGGPLSWWMFYKSLFGAAQTDGATYAYIRSFLTTMIHLAWCVWMILGLKNLGEFSAGLFPMFAMFSMRDAKGIAFGVMFIINIALWGLAAVGAFLLLGLAVAAYRRGDGPRKAYEQRTGGVQMQAV